MFPIMSSPKRREIFRKAQSHFANSGWNILLPPSKDNEDFIAERGKFKVLVASFDPDNQSFVPPLEIVQRMAERNRARQSNFPGALIFVSDDPLIGLANEEVAKRGACLLDLKNLNIVTELYDDFSRDKFDIPTNLSAIAILQGAELFSLEVVAQLNKRGQRRRAIKLAEIIVDGSYKVRECHYALVDLYMQADDRAAANVLLEKMGGESTNNKRVLHKIREAGMRWSDHDRVANINRRLEALTDSAPTFESILRKQRENIGVSSEPPRGNLDQHSERSRWQLFAKSIRKIVQ